ncbi:hypothetical protein DRP77_10445 [Candidatus Poribacteria bacterium]|nr:MAG: hypothetical protein DRP77_10445 [Candidatus Poribacteria bacterium]
MRYVGVLLALALATAAMAAPPEVVIYYSFDKIEGNTVIDESGNGHNGTIVGNITQVDGVRGKAAKFEKGSYIDLDGPNFPKEHIPTSAFTLAAWVNCENTGDHHAIFNARASDGTWLIHPELRRDGVYRFCLRGYGSQKICDIKAGQVKWGQWVHFAGTYDRAAKKVVLYIDGEVIQEVDAMADVDIAGDWGMGARVGFNIDNKRPFTGLMDDFVIYSRALSQDEIKTLMEKGPAIPSAVRPEGRLATFWGAVKASL